MGVRPAGEFNPYAAELIKHKTRRLIGQFGINRNDAEEIAQDVAAHLIERMPQFDPKRAKVNTFIDRVVKNKLLNIIEARTAQKRDGHRRARALDDVPRGSLLEHGRTVSDVDRALDVRDILGSLPPDLREFAERLKLESPADAARTLGLTRAQMRNRLEAIRTHFDAADRGSKPAGQQPVRRRSR
jgi:DNA-directed RNA polymerase specialized sigma24 family protein